METPNSSWTFDTHWPDALRLAGPRPEVPACEARRWRSDFRLARKLLLDQKLEEGHVILERLRQSLEVLPADKALRLGVDLDALRAVGAMLGDDALRALYIARKVLLGRQTSGWAFAAAYAVGQFACWRLRDFESLQQLPQRRLRAHRYRLARIVGLCIDAAIELEQLRLAVAGRLALRALEEAQRAGCRNGMLTALPACLLAQVCYEQGALDDAETLLLKRLATIAACASPEPACRAYRVLSRIAAAREQWVVAVSHLQEAQSIGERRGWPGLAALSFYERTRLSALRGRFDDAHTNSVHLEQLATQHRTACGCSGPQVQRYLRLARTYVALHGHATPQIVEALRQLHHEAFSARHLYSAARRALEICVATARLGDLQQSDPLFLRTLGLGALAGLHQSFIERRALLEPLLQRASDRARQGEPAYQDLMPYIGSLLAPQRLAGPPRALLRGPSVRAVDGLSARECDILLLVCRGLSNKRIACSLTIAPETVKAHVKKIFIKLDVRSRAAAVFRASALGLLPGTDDRARAR